MMETYGKEDMYPSEFVVSDEHGHSCVVTTEWLYQAMTKLKECQKEVLILEFWYGLSRKEVAELFSVSETNNQPIGKEKAFNFNTRIIMKGKQYIMEREKNLIMKQRIAQFTETMMRK